MEMLAKTTLQLRKMELEFQKKKFEAKAEERKAKLKLELEERWLMLDLLKDKHWLAHYRTITEATVQSICQEKKFLLFFKLKLWNLLCCV